MANQTKEQIRYRLQAILGNKTLSRLFLAPQNTIDFFEELNSGSVILIDTSKAFLAETQSSYMGKIAIALVLNAIAMRTGYCHSTMVYIDEAHEYFSEKIDTFLNQARKKKAGITLAHQNLSQLPTSQLRNSIASSTSIKFVGGTSDHDARILARDMRTTLEFIQSQSTLHFACYVKNAGTTSVKVPVGILDTEAQMSDEEYEAFRIENRALVARGAAPDDGADDLSSQVEPDVEDDPTMATEEWE